MTRSTLVIEKAIERVQKLLALAKGTSEHEAALAAGRAAALIEQFQLTEAQLRIDDAELPPEPIEQCASLTPGKYARKRVAWSEALARATAADLGVKIYWVGADVRGFGRESAIQTWRYTYGYLVRAVEDLATQAWGKVNTDESVRSWKSGFRLGCAQRIATRMWEEREERKRKAMWAAVHARQAREAGLAGDERNTMALAIVVKDQAEVDATYADFSSGWTRKISSIGSTSSYSGYEHGRAAGDKVRLGGDGKALGAGTKRIKGDT